MGWAIPEQVILGCKTKQAEQVLESKPGSALLYCLCFRSCLQVPALFEFLL